LGDISFWFFEGVIPMTTTVMAHLPADQPKRLLIETFDRVYDHANQVMTDEWKKVNFTIISAGHLFQTHCTDSRRVLVSEIPLAEPVA
jgi:hypothetical protein